MALQRIWEWSVAMIEKSEVRAVDRGARKDASGNRREHVTRI
jgi:hypothetical protein